MPACAEPGCPALAADGFDRCVVHAKGLKRHHVRSGDENELMCDDCHHRIRDGHWYRTGGGRTTHLGPCPETKEL